MRPREEVYDTYWYLAERRQEIFFKKLKNQKPPYSEDPILNTYKFCNAYRASDRVSQFLIRDVIYSSSLDERDTLFRIFLFRIINKIETWRSLETKLGKISLRNFETDRYSKLISEMLDSGTSVFGNAFILCANKTFGFERKHDNYLALLEKIFIKDKIDGRLLKSKSLRELFLLLRSLPLIGDFMAYQIAIDFNYSEVFDFSENDFTVAGPGAVRGIRKCFKSIRGNSYAQVIDYMVKNQDKEFEKRGIKFKNLFGRSLHVIDCQGLFCELDKYSRVKFPNLKSNRIRIKAKYKRSRDPIIYFYPPKWKINDKVAVYSASS